MIEPLKFADLNCGDTFILRTDGMEWRKVGTKSMERIADGKYVVVPSGIVIWGEKK